jgi:membrane protease YdiL (CAAX protease family)
VDISCDGGCSGAVCCIFLRLGSSHRDARRAPEVRGVSLPSARIWRAAIPPIVFGIIALIALRLLLPSLMPVGAPSIPISFSSLPLPTIIGALLSIVMIAAVTEEIAFRGYMQKPMEDAYGIIPAVLIVGVMLWVAHLDHDISVTHLPFHISASIALGLLAYLTRSLVPAMIAHGVGDLLLVPAYFFLRHHCVDSADQRGADNIRFPPPRSGKPSERRVIPARHLNASTA